VEFGQVPKEITVALETPRVEDVVKPLVKAPLVPIDAEQLDKPLEVALAPPPKQALPPPVVPPPPPPPPEQEKPKDKFQPPPPNMVMVEVKDDKSVVKDAPADAKQLSDKNRDVAEETRAKETNLEKEQD